VWYQGDVELMWIQRLTLPVAVTEFAVSGAIRPHRLNNGHLVPHPFAVTLSSSTVSISSGRRICLHRLSPSQSSFRPRAASSTIFSGSRHRIRHHRPPLPKSSSMRELAVTPPPPPPPTKYSSSPAAGCTPPSRRSTHNPWLLSICCRPKTLHYS
jgi:hypothetical protein